MVNIYYDRTRKDSPISSLSNTGIFGTHVYFSVNESVFDYDLAIICVDNHKLIDSLHLSTLQTFNIIQCSFLNETILDKFK